MILYDKTYVMNGKQLKNSILQWAIQGKLVPQDPNDEPASVLLEKIRQEKERLIKEKKIKRDKNASIIYRGEDNSYYEKILATGEVKCIDEEIPFEVPKGWEWERFGNIMINKDSERVPLSVAQRQQLKKIYDYYGASGVIDKVDKYLFDKDLLLIGEDGANLINRSTPIAFIAKGKYWVNNHAHVLDVCSGMALSYVALFINAISLVDYITGTAQPKMNQEKMNSILLAIPPVKEQHRILEKMSMVDAFVDKYASLQTKLDSLDNSVYELLRKSILQEAIQGKLVPQIASEGTAQELLEQLKAEKQKLVKEGKLKRSALNNTVILRGDDNKYYEQIGKHCEDITEEIPFELPASWNWTRGKIVFMPMESTKPTSDFIYIDVDAVNNKLNIIDNAKQMSIDNAPSRATRKLHQNDILFSMVRPYLRNIALVDDTYKSAIASTGFYVITPRIVYFPKFLFYLMLSNYVVDGLNTFMKGDNSPSINNSHIENYLYPLPPFKEQQRIVAQIEKLFEQLH